MTGLILVFIIMGHVTTIATVHNIIKAVVEDEAFNKRLGLTTFPSSKILRSVRTSLYVTLGLLILATGVYFLER